MPAPKPSTIVLILAVFACVALYFLGVGLGAQDRTGVLSVPLPAERERLRERFIKPPPVEARELRATGCALSGVTVRVVVGSSCRVDIAESDERLRALEVVPLSGSQVNGRLEPKGGPAVPVSIKNLGKSQRLDVPREGAVLSLVCIQPVGSTSECPVRLR